MIRHEIYGNKSVNDQKLERPLEIALDEIIGGKGLNIFVLISWKLGLGSGFNGFYAINQGNGKKCNF